MIKPMKLKGIVQREADTSLTFHGNLHDNSPFEIRVREHDVELNQPFKRDKDRVEGWLFIQQQAKQGNRVYVTLPSPSLQHGHHVLVHELLLMPINASIADFEAKKPPVPFPAKMLAKSINPKKNVVKKDVLTVDEEVAKTVLERQEAVEQEE